MRSSKNELESRCFTCAYFACFIWLNHLPRGSCSFTIWTRFYQCRGWIKIYYTRACAKLEKRKHELNWQDASLAIPWFPQPRKYYFPGNFRDFSRTILLFSRTKYTRFKGNKSCYMCDKAYQIYSMCDRLLAFLWYSLLLTSSAMWSIHLNFNCQDCTCTLFCLQLKFSSTGIIFIHRQYLFHDVS